jgi:sulfofructose kinase
MTRPATILCAGMAVLDEVFRVERFPAANAKAQAAAFMSVVGGCAANAAVAIVRLGGKAQLAAALGAPADHIGDRILAALAREGVACPGIVRVKDANSTVSAILIDAQGTRSIVSYCDERLFTAVADDPAALLAGVDAVLADNWLPDLVVPICAAARDRGLPVIVDGDGPMAEDAALVRLASHLVFSAEGLRAATGAPDLGVALRRIGKHAHGFVAVTDGADDILWLEDESVRALPVFAVDAVDTLAAGDVFHGAFALALTEGSREVEALRFAAAAAGVKCTRLGGGSGAPNRSEVDSLIRSQASGGRTPDP